MICPSKMSWVLEFAFPFYSPDFSVWVLLDSGHFRFRLDFIVVLKDFFVCLFLCQLVLLWSLDWHQVQDPLASASEVQGFQETSLFCTLIFLFMMCLGACSMTVSAYGVIAFSRWVIVPVKQMSPLQLSLCSVCRSYFSNNVKANIFFVLSTTWLNLKTLGDI